MLRQILLVAVAYKSLLPCWCLLHLVCVIMWLWNHMKIFKHMSQYEHIQTNLCNSWITTVLYDIGVESQLYSVTSTLNRDCNLWYRPRIITVLCDLTLNRDCTLWHGARIMTVFCGIGLNFYVKFCVRFSCNQDSNFYLLFNCSLSVPYSH